MAGQIIESAATLTAGLRSDFIGTYRRMYDSILPRLSRVMQLGVPSDKITEFYAYYESAPHPVRWSRGNNIASKGFKSVGYNVTNYDWGRRIEWHVNDRMDDQTKSLFQQARALGENFALLHERIFFQIIRSANDPDLLPSIPLAPDGASLYATTVSGVDRFGAPGGNLLTGSGVSTAQDIRNDFFNAIEQFKLFQDTEGQPLLHDDILDRGIVVIYGAKNERVFREAFRQERTVQTQVVGGTGTAAAVTNIIMESGLAVTLQSTQRIPDDDWFIFLEGTEIKPIFQQERQGLQENVATMDNSDSARDTKIEYIQWHARYGYGINVPYQTIMINN